MNRTLQTAALLIALAVLFSFAQDSVVDMANKPIVYDTVHRVISDSVTISALENSQSFYESAFKDIQGSFYIFLSIIAILVTIVGIWVHKAKKDNEEALGQLKEALKQQEEQRKSLGKLKEETEKESKAVKEKVLNLEDELRKQFDTSFRFVSRIYRKQAEDFLNKEDNFQEYLYYMHIFYRCLIQIKRLNKYDLSRLERTYNLLFNNKNIKKIIKLENNDNICWHIVHLLKFIKRCSNDVTLSEYFRIARSIYKYLFTLKFSNFTSNNDIIKELENRMKNDGWEGTEIQETLELAIKYKDDQPPNESI